MINESGGLPTRKDMSDAVDLARFAYSGAYLELSVAHGVALAEYRVTFNVLRNRNSSASTLTLKFNTDGEFLNYED
jgi:hypothetical protein